MKYFKAFNKGMICRNKHYEVGKVYEENGVCFIPLNLCKKTVELLKEQREIINRYQWEDGEPK